MEWLAGVGALLGGGGIVCRDTAAARAGPTRRSGSAKVGGGIIRHMLRTRPRGGNLSSGLVKISATTGTVLRIRGAGSKWQRVSAHGNEEFVGRAAIRFRDSGSARRR